MPVVRTTLLPASFHEIYLLLDFTPLLFVFLSDRHRIPYSVSSDAPFTTTLPFLQRLERPSKHQFLRQELGEGDPTSPSLLVPSGVPPTVLSFAELPPHGGA
jgi:hypothetical protein